MITDGIIQAARLLISLDSEVLQVLHTTLYVTGAAIITATIIGLPIAVLITLYEFRLKELLITAINSLLSMPTVTIGLLVFALLSRQGPFGSLKLLFTPTAMIIGEVILGLPIIVAFSISSLNALDRRLYFSLRAVGASSLQIAFWYVKEAKFGLVAAIVAAFGRIISEVGAAMMLGGNIRGSTRTLTTAITLETGKGEFGLAFALGLILITVAISINILFRILQGRFSGNAKT